VDRNSSPRKVKPDAQRLLIVPGCHSTADSAAWTLPAGAYGEEEAPIIDVDVDNVEILDTEELSE